MNLKLSKVQARMLMKSTLFFKFGGLCTVINILTSFLHHQIHPGLLYTHSVHHNTLVQATVGSTEVCYCEVSIP